VEVPTASLLPGVQVGIVPGAPGADWPWARAGTAHDKRKIIRTGGQNLFERGAFEGEKL
jgi:hypothetical protein